MTNAAFLAKFGEFSATDTTKVTEALATAEREAGDLWTGDRRDDYVALVAADALARSPEGRRAQLMNKSGKTQYEQRIKDLRSQQTFALSRIVT